MTILLPVLAVAFAAFCVWLTVRIVNRRERWAKWMLVAVVGVPVLYVLSFGPVCWLQPPQLCIRAPQVYWPLGWAMDHAGQPIWDAFGWYVGFGAPDGAAYVALPTANNSIVRVLYFGDFPVPDRNWENTSNSSAPE